MKVRVSRVPFPYSLFGCVMGVTTELPCLYSSGRSLILREYLMSGSSFHLTGEEKTRIYCTAVRGDSVLGSLDLMASFDGFGGEVHLYVNTTRLFYGKRHYG